jgi:NAD(P)-dependent dehydrogenase (short-subunit alcohol dehydrogenase family)
MKLTHVVVTGANRGLGRSLVEELLRRDDVKKIYATARTTEGLKAIEALDPRVRGLAVDITDPAQVQSAADTLVREGTPPTLVINNAGLLASYGVLDSSLESIRRDVETNYFGLLNIARSFGPLLERSKGALVSVLSVASLASMPALGGYSASKAAAFSLTQALRAQLGAKGVRVHAAFPGPIDTDMIRSFEMPKTKPADVAAAILDGVSSDTADIFPDPMSREVGATWQKDPRSVEKRFAT